MATIFKITAFLLKIGHVGPLHCYECYCT